MTDLVATAHANNPLYDVSADQWNNLIAKLNNMIWVQSLESGVGLGYVEIAENTDHTTVTHNIGSLPKAVVFAPVDDVGRCWYDMNTVTVNAIDIYVANPPIGGSYLVPVLYYYVP